MPTYAYQCEKCDTKFDIVKRMADSDVPEICANCDNLTTNKLVTPFSFIVPGGKDYVPTYNAGLGQVVRSDRHKREILADYKARGEELVEVGTEPVEKLVQKAESDHKAIRDERWAKIDPMKAHYEVMNGI